MYLAGSLTLPALLGMSEPYDCRESQGHDTPSLLCNMYFESRGEGRLGMAATAHVTLNRMKHRYFPNTIQGVVWQYKQFSWTWKRDDMTTRELKVWKKIMKVAKGVLDGSIPDPTGGALFFHRIDIFPPDWAEKKDITAVIGDHIYYK